MKRPLPPLLPFQPGFADLAISICLAILVLITRLPFRTGALYNWDSANFALALDHYDVTRHHPHPPGYFYYVIGARLLGLALGEANASLVAEGIIFSVLAVVSVYFLGKALFDRSCGLTAAILLMFSVTFWSYGTIALPYVSLAFFSAGAAFFAYRAASKRPHSLLALSTTYAIGGGFRPDLLLLLGPLWLFSHLRQPKREIGLSIGLVAVGFALWFVPTVWLSGGLDSYRAVLLAYLEVDVVQKYSSTSRGLGGLLVNARDTASYLFYALYFTALPLLVGLAYIARHPGALRGRLPIFLAVWLLPMFAFYVVVHVGDPGYVFTILPALVVLGARATAELADQSIPPALSHFKVPSRLRRAVVPAVVAA
ncbi:MAG: glycosyltransferase family 39 protein, partial [Chloroflexi bacterium]|nr:glycosyltransferase family 39 protein [Chloroflexota bacterium]